MNTSAIKGKGLLMCKVFDIRGLYCPDYYRESETKFGDYELEQPAASDVAQHETIRGFGVSSVPVKENGRILYDTSVTKDGRLLYWNTLTEPVTALTAILEDFEHCQKVYKAESGIHGTYFEPENLSRKVVPTM